jgi:hypothetical protein
VKKIVQTVQIIRSLLEQGAPNASAAKAAADYARYCGEAEQRLEMVAAMLEKGSDYQALQIAEQEPALLDLVGVLSFGEEKAWQHFCEDHQLAVAPRLNAKTTHALDALYASGITANHPLYKDFRAAVLSRDDAKSLRILHTILKLNPTDENAKKELLRIDNKQFQETLETLREALKTDDEERIACLVEALAASAPEEKLQRFEAYVAGTAIRRSLRRRQAERRLPEMVEQMLDQQAGKDWRSVGAGLEALEALKQEHGIEVVDEALKRGVDGLKQFYSDESSADLHRRSFEKSLRDCMARIDEVETRLRSGDGMAYDEVVDMDAALARHSKELLAHQMPLPAETAQRLQSTERVLQSRLDGLRLARRLQRVATAAAVVGALTCTVALILHGWKAHVVSSDLAGYQARRVCVPAETLIRRLRQDNDWLLYWPNLQSTVEEVDAWTRQMHAAEKQAGAALEALEASFVAEASNLPPAQLVRQFEHAEELVRSLPQDLTNGPSNQIAALRTRIELHLEREGKQLAARVGESLTKVEQTCAAELSYENPVAKTVASVEKIAGMLAPLESALKPEVEALRLPADLEARILSSSQRLDLFQNELVKFDKARAETAAAGSLTGYLEALTRWKALKFAEAAPATKALAVLPTEAAFLASLLTHGDQVMLKAVQDDLSGAHMQPASPLEEDLKALLAIRDDAYLNNIWENRMVDYSRGSSETVWWSNGALTRANIGENVRWSGRFYEPAPTSTSVAFVKRDVVRIPARNSYVGMEVLDSKLSATSQFVSSLQLHRMTDEDGRRFKRSLLEVIETAMKDNSASPVAKAYVIQRLASMMRRREQAWGLHLCPSLQADLRELGQILGENSLRSEDWLVTASRDRLSAPLVAFFKKHENKSYLGEAAARRRVLQGAALAGIRFGGYVELDSTLVLNNPARAASELWVISADGGKPRLVLNSTAGKTAADTGRTVVREALTLSPVFFMPQDRQALLRQYKADMAAAKAELRPSSEEAPFLIP